MFPDTIQTERLRLERLSRETLSPLVLYNYVHEGAPHIDEITEHISWEPHSSPKVSRDFIVEQESAWEDDETATYVVRPKDGEDGAGSFAGITSLDVDWPRETGTLGIWLRKPFWGRGYSGERADALLELAFDTLDLDLVTVSHFPANEKSRSAIERYVEENGGRREGTFRNHVVGTDGTAHDAVRYSISQSEWRDAAEAE